MRTRIVIGSGAWLLGAAAATAGGLYVVSELGHGISGSPASQQSSVAAAVQAQAGQAASHPPSSSTAPRSQGGTGGQGGTSGASTGGKGGTASTSGTVLGSSGGTVVAQRAGHHRAGRVHHRDEHGDDGGVLRHRRASRRDHRDECRRPRPRPVPVGDGR